MRLLTGEELPDHFVHDVLWREKVREECGQHPSQHTSLVRVTLLYSVGRGGGLWEIKQGDNIMRGYTGAG